MSESGLTEAEKKVPLKTLRYGFVWIKASDLLATKMRAWLAICGFSKRVAKIVSLDNALYPMTVHDTYITTRRGCEERGRCYDFDCPHNKTTWETLRQNGEVGSRAKKPKGFGEQTLAVNLKPDGTLHDFSDLIGNPHEGGIIRSGRNS